MPEPESFDSLLPPQMAARAEHVGVKKACMPSLDTFVLSVLAGAFIALGAMFSTTVLAGASPVLPFGVSRLLAGLAFSLGLILVIVGGAELFTGNTLIVMAWANRRISTVEMLTNWFLVYCGNFGGALGAAALVYFSGTLALNGDSVGELSAAIANAKLA